MVLHQAQFDAFFRRILGRLFGRKSLTDVSDVDVFDRRLLILCRPGLYVPTVLINGRRRSSVASAANQIPKAAGHGACIATAIRCVPPIEIH